MSEDFLPKPLLFDVMGTLVYDPFHEVMPQFFEMSFEELLREKHPRSWLEFELGERNEEGFLRNFFADGRVYDTRGFVETVSAAYRFLPGVLDLLRDLETEKADLHLFSNYPSWHHHVEAATGLSRFAKWTFVSWEQGLRKPDAAAFLRCAELAGTSVEGTIFVDDQKRNIDAALALGLDAIQFVDAVQLRGALVTRGVLSA